MLSATLAELQAEGLVTFFSSPNNNIKFIQLTDKGPRHLERRHTR